MIINVLIIKISIYRRYVFYEEDANFFLVATRLSNRCKDRECYSNFSLSFSPRRTNCRCNSGARRWKLTRSRLWYARNSMLVRDPLIHLYGTRGTFDWIAPRPRRRETRAMERVRARFRASFSPRGFRTRWNVMDRDFCTSCPTFSLLDCRFLRLCYKIHCRR